MRCCDDQLNPPIVDRWETRERIVVAMTGGVDGERLIRRAGRLASRLRGDLIGLHVVQTGSGREAGPELQRHRDLLSEIGGTYREVVDDDVARALVRFADGERATQAVFPLGRRTTDDDRSDPRTEGVAAIRWFRHPKAVMQTHTFNAWDGGAYLHLDHFITASGWLSQFPDLQNPDAREAPPFAQRWSFDLRSDSDAFEITKLFEHIGEMPVIDPLRATRQHHHYYFGTTNHALGPMLEFGPKGPPFTCLGHYNDATGELTYFYAGPHSAPEEPLLIPRSSNAPEGDGWLISIVGRRAENRTDLVILDALDIAAGPVSTIRIPIRLHEGFHGTWVGSTVTLGLTAASGRRISRNILQIR